MPRAPRPTTTTTTNHRRRRWRIEHADCLDALPKLDAASVDALITDRPDIIVPVCTHPR